jgi:hypothetical protein
MIVELNFHDLMKLAANSKVEKDGVTIKIERPILPMINHHAPASHEYVLFSLDSTDPRSKEFAWDALKQK